MKKTLVAVAALVATGAFAQVTITGVLESAILSQGGATSVSNGTNGTEFQFGLSDDLGNGMKAIGSVALLMNPADGETAYANTAIGNATTAGAPGSVSMYNSYIGLSGEFGSLKLGQQFSPTFFVSAVGDVAGRSGLSSYKAGGLTAQVANSATITSPSFMGLVVQYQKVLNNSITAIQGKGHSGYSLTYTNGGLTAAYGGETNSVYSTTISGITETVYGVSYNFGVAKVHAGGSGKNTAKAAASAVGISVPFGAVTVAVGTSKQSTTTATDYAVSYGFSKRTLGYVGMNTTTGASNTTVAGIRHNF
jgi:hypothetical protein